MLLQYKITVNQFIISECVKFSFKNCPCHMLGHKLKIIIFLIVIRTYVCDNIHLGLCLIPSGQSFVFFFFLCNNPSSLFYFGKFVFYIFNSYFIYIYLDLFI
jgi:hypothetical protein